MGVETIAHRSSLSAAAFSDEARALVAGGGPAMGRREREVGSTLHGRKSGKRGLGHRSPWTSSRRRRRPDSDGGALGQGRSASDMDDDAVETGAREATATARTAGGAVGRAVGTPTRSPDSALKAHERRGRHERVAATRRRRADRRARRGKQRLTGGPHSLVFFVLKITPRRK
jgi:hypothetical protein